MIPINIPFILLLNSVKHSLVLQTTVVIKVVIVALFVNQTNFLEIETFLHLLLELTTDITRIKELTR